MLFLVALVGLFSQSVQAAGILIPYGLFQFEDESGHYIFVGQDRQSNNHYQVWDIVAKPGQAPILTTLSMKKGSTQSDGGGISFFLAGDTHLSIPDYDDTDLRATLAYPNRARENLIKETESVAEFERLGILPLLHPDFLTPPASVTAGLPDVLRSPQTMSIVWGTALPDQNGKRSAFGEAYQSAQILRKIVKTYPESEARFLDGPGYGSALVLIEEQWLPELLKKMEALPGLRFEVISEVKLNSDAPTVFNLKQSNLATVAVASLAKTVSLSQKLTVVSALVKADVPVISRFTAEEKAAFIEPLRGLLQQLEAQYQQIYQLSLSQLTYESSDRLLRERPFLRAQERMDLVYAEAEGSIRGYPLFQRLGFPAREAEAKVQELLHLLDTEESRRSVLMTAHGNNGSALHLMETISASTGQNYLDFWLNWLTAEISESSKLPRGLTAKERSEAGFTTNTRTASYSSFKGTGDETFWHRKESSRGIESEIESVRANPFFLLGLSRDAKAVRETHKKIVSFIIQTDRMVEQQIQSENEGRLIAEIVDMGALGAGSEPAIRQFVQEKQLSDASIALLVQNVPVLGRMQHDQVLKMAEEILTQVRLRKYAPSEITGNTLLHNFIRSLAYIQENFANVPEFSSEVYQENGLLIVTELLESAQVSVATPGTYQAVLDAAISLLKKVDPHSRKAVRLTQVMQKNLLNGLWYLGDEGCDQLLTPNPWKAWMKRSGHALEP